MPDWQLPDCILGYAKLAHCVSMTTYIICVQIMWLSPEWCEKCPLGSALYSVLEESDRRLPDLLYSYPLPLHNPAKWIDPNVGTIFHTRIWSGKVYFVLMVVKWRGYVWCLFPIKALEYKEGNFVVYIQGIYTLIYIGVCLFIWIFTFDCGCLCIYDRFSGDSYIYSLTPAQMMSLCYR